MATTYPDAASVVDGVIETANDHGVKLRGEAEWRNVSKYAQPRPMVPIAGTRVRLNLDKGGFIRSIDSGGALAAPAADHPTPKQSYDSQPTVAQAQPQQGYDRDTRIMRQAVLNTAVAILGSGGQVAEIGDVIAYAETLEQWVTR